MEFVNPRPMSRNSDFRNNPAYSQGAVVEIVWTAGDSTDNPVSLTLWQANATTADFFGSMEYITRTCYFTSSFTSPGKGETNVKRDTRERRQQNELLVDCCNDKGPCRVKRLLSQSLRGGPETRRHRQPVLQHYRQFPRSATRPHQLHYFHQHRATDGQPQRQRQSQRQRLWLFNVPCTHPFDPDRRPQRTGV